MSQSLKQTSQNNQQESTRNQPLRNSVPTTQHGHPHSSIISNSNHHDSQQSPLAAAPQSFDDDSFDFDSVNVEEQAQQYAWLEHQQRELLKNSGKKEKGKVGKKSKAKGFKLDLSSSSSSSVNQNHSQSLSNSYGSSNLSSSRDNKLRTLEDYVENNPRDEEIDEEEDGIESEMIINPINGFKIQKHLYSPISILPIEILIQSFVRLDPISLFNSSLVVKSWNEMIKDESVWRDGFGKAFGLSDNDHFEKAEETELKKGVKKEQKDSRVSLRRIDNKSWRGEYWRRTDLARRWKKSRTTTVLSDPRISTVEAFAFSREHHFSLSASVTYGVASRSDPFSGKVTKGFLDATGLINGLGIGNPNVEFSPDVTCVSIDSDTSRIIWGFRTGLISLTTLNRQGASPRGNIKSFNFSNPNMNNGSHLGEIRCISTPFGTNQGNGRNGGGCGGSKSPMRNREKLRKFGLSLGEKVSTFATAGKDGSVRIWKEDRIEPIWIGWAIENQDELHSSSNGFTIPTIPRVSSSHSSKNLKPISALEYDASEGVILAGNDEGDLFLWSNIDISALMGISPKIFDSSLNPSAISSDLREEKTKFQKIQKSMNFLHIPKLNDEIQPIKHLVLDVKPNQDVDFSILSHRNGSKIFFRHSIKFESNPSDSIQSNDDSRDPLKVESPIISTAIFGSSSSSEILSLRADFDFEDTTSSKGVGITSLTSSPSRSPHLGPSKPNSGRKSNGKGHLQTKINSSSLESSTPTNLVLGPTNTALIDSQKGKGVYYERKFVVVGTKDGRTLIFDWESDGEIFDESTQKKWQSSSSSNNIQDSNNNVSYSLAVANQSSSSSSNLLNSIELIKSDRQISPSLTFPRHTTSITSLEITPSFVITGSSDGIIKIYDSLTTQLIRIINDRQAKNAASRLLASGELSNEDSSRFLVRQIIASDETLVASIGSQTLAWKAENKILNRRERKNGIGNQSNHHGSSSTFGSKFNGSSKRLDSKIESVIYLKREVLESEEIIEKEKELRNHGYEKLLFERKFGNKNGFGDDEDDEFSNGLNESEALEYALMISRDEEESKRIEKALNESFEEENISQVKGKGKSKSKSKSGIVNDDDGDDDLDLKEVLKQIEESENQSNKQSSKVKEEEAISLDNLDESEDWPSPSLSNHSLSPSPSPLSSPVLNGMNTPSRAMEILNASGKNTSFSSGSGKNRPDYGRAFGSQSREINDKVRTVNVSRDARLSVSSSFSNYSSSPSPRFKPSSSINYGNGNNDITPLSLNSPEHWPAVSPPKRSPNSNGLNNNPLDLNSRSSSTSSSSFKGSSSFNHQHSGNSNSPSFSSFWRSQSSSPNPSSPSHHAISSTSNNSWNRKFSLSGAWSNGSPSLRATSLSGNGIGDLNTNRQGGTSSSSSLLGRSLNQGTGRSSNGLQEEEMDEEMRFAIELSLAEERSRIETEKNI